MLQIETILERREKLIRAFGKKCLRLDQTKDLFPINENHQRMKTRKREMFQVIPANTERLKNSTVPYIQRMLNQGKNT